MYIVVKRCFKEILPTVLVALLFFFYPVHTSAADIKIEGRVFTESGPLKGATVHAYESYNGVISDTAFRVSDRTDNQGQYKLRLPQGEYYMTARGTKAGRRFFAYLGANPIRVNKENLWIVFMANEIKKPSYSNGNAEVKGVVTFKGKPVKDAYIAFYTLESRKFKGIGYRTEQVKEDGSFLFPLAADKYVIIARKTTGNEIRPLDDGDLYCYYPSNPLDVKPGKLVSIEVPCYPKAERSSFASSPVIKANDYSTVKNLGDERKFGIKGKVTDSGEEPVKGIYVLAYKVDPANTPALAKTFRGIHETENITKTDQNGNYFIPLDDDGNYAVVARSMLGTGTPKGNEIYGVYKNTFRKGIAFKKGQIIQEINITVVTPLQGADPGVE
jgi:hypothetical protein